MPIVDGNYQSPTWRDDQPPAIDAKELQAITDSLEDTFSKSKTLSTATAQKLGLTDTAVPDDAFNALIKNYAVATINITALSGATVTVKKDDATINTHIGTGNPVAVYIGQLGIYTITAVKSGSTIEKGAAITEANQIVDVDVTHNDKLPWQFAELQYIQNTAIGPSAYIDTGLTFQVDDAEIDTTINVQNWGGFGSSTSSLYYAQFFGMTTVSPHRYLLFSSYNGNTYAYISLFDATINFTFGLNTDAKIHAKGKNGVMTVSQDGASLGSKTYTFESLDTPFRLFSAAAGSHMGCYAKMGETKIWYQGNLVRDFVPAKRIEDSAVGMYDIVNGKFYQSSTNATFVAGPEVT